jgi:hypothetical protein
MKNLIILTVIAAAISMQSCKAPQAAAPATGMTSYCTTSEQIYKLTKGMDYNQVNTILGVSPTAIYINYKDGTKIISYKYKLRYQKVSSGQQDSEMSLRGGEEIYRDESNLYVVFDANTNKVIYYVTDKGRKNAKDLINKSIELKYVNN